MSDAPKIIINQVWKLGPEICSVTMLPAFETKNGLTDFMNATGSLCLVLSTYQCEHCNRWHSDTLPPSPAGDSSGNGRGAYAVRDIQLRAARLAAAKKKNKR